MEKVATILAEYMLKEKVILKEDFEIYKYGFLMGMEVICSILACLCIAIQMKMINECLVFFLLFYSLRSYVGGLHLNNFPKCFTCSLSVLYLTLWAIKSCSVSIDISAFLSICEILLIYVLKPVENANRPIDDEEKLLFLQKLHKHLGVVVGCIVFLYILKWDHYMNVITYTLGVIIISMFLGEIKNQIEILRA